MSSQPPPDLKPYFQTLDDLSGVIDWREFFGNAHPIELDIGCGRGMFLVNAGLMRPEINYLGIELDYKEARHGAKRVYKRKMPNVRVLGGDANIALERFIPPGSVAAVHVYFPDPWWKRKHLRRRLFTDRFADRIAAVLQPDGLLHVWTDVADYFEVVSALLNHHEQFAACPPPEERPAEHDLDYQTSFERKKRQAGYLIHRGLWKKQPVQALQSE